MVDQILQSRSEILKIRQQYLAQIQTVNIDSPLNEIYKEKKKGEELFTIHSEYIMDLFKSNEKDMVELCRNTARFGLSSVKFIDNHFITQSTKKDKSLGVFQSAKKSQELLDSIMSNRKKLSGINKTKVILSDISESLFSGSEFKSEQALRQKILNAITKKNKQAEKESNQEILEIEQIQQLTDDVYPHAKTNAFVTSSFFPEQLLTSCIKNSICPKTLGFKLGLDDMDVTIKQVYALRSIQQAENQAMIEVIEEVDKNVQKNISK